MKKFLKIDDLSEYLGIKKSTLYAKASRGEIPHYKIDRLIRFKRTEIDSWIERFKKEDKVSKENPVRHLRTLKSHDINDIVRKVVDDSKTVKL